MIRIFGILLLTINIHSAKFVFAAETKQSISSIFEGLGYSSVCVASALATCELSVHTSKPYVHPLTDVVKDRPRNCQDILSQGDHTSGIRTVYPYSCCRDRPVVVFCDQETDGGGWTVFQNRDSLPIREDFYRTWWEYVLGFGNVTGEYWLGLDNLHALVSLTLHELRVDLEDYEGTKRFAKYGSFYVGDSTKKYSVGVGRYSGDAGDALMESNGMMFSTHDHDNDAFGGNCALSYRGAWWYNKCHASNLNGYQYIGSHASHADGINWYPFREYNYSLKKTNMKVRPAFL